MSDTSYRAGSDEFNALPFEQRALLNRMILASELRLIEAEKKRIAADYRRAIRGHNERAKRIKQFLMQESRP